MTILRMSISASILILAIVVIRAVMLNRLPKKAFLVLWGVALFRLLIPLNLSSRFSIFAMVNEILRLSSTQGSFVTNVGGDMLLPNMSVASTATAQGEMSLWVVVWLIGMLAAALFFIITHLRCRQSYKMALPIDNAIVIQWQKEHLTKRTVKIKQSDKITTPLTYGILRPVVLLPKTMDCSDNLQMQYVLVHEYTHIKRFDILIKWILAAGLCIHWFNPLVWVLYILANRDIELVCDEVVVRTFGETMKSTYAFALIGLEEKKSRLNPLCSNFSKNAIEERITSIMKMKKTSLVGMVLAVILVCGTTTVFATSSSETTDTIKSTYATKSTDENYIQSIPKSTTGTITLNSNNETDQHDIAVNEKMIYIKKNGQCIEFNATEAHMLQLKITDRKFDYGQNISIGYIVDNSQTQLFEGQIKNGTVVDFIAPKDGKYSFYVECVSSDPLRVENFSIR